MQTGSQSDTASAALWHSELHWPRLWTLIGLALVAAVTVASLVRVSIPFNSWLSSDKFVHLSVYAFLMLWFLQIYRRLPAQLLIALALWATSAAIELFQGLMPYRHLDVFDLMANSVGILLALLMARAGLIRLLSGFERWWLAVRA